jgi:two-component system, cell cycle response regulator
MTVQPPSGPTRPDTDEPEVAMREARQRFIAAFPKRSDSIGLLLGMVATLGSRGPIGPLRQIVHRLTGLAGTLGFPTISKHAASLETLLMSGDPQALDTRAADNLFDAINDAFASDLAQPPEWAAAERPSAQYRGRILVVEDDEDQREVVMIHLRAAGHEVVPVASGDLVADLARAHNPSLILLDANLPGLDGFSVCRELKADPELAHIPVIFMTVRSTLDDRLVGLMLGADDYLVKPLEIPELLLRIELLLRRRAVEPPAPQARVVSESPELDYESFVAVGREQIATMPSVLVAVRTQGDRLQDVYLAMRAESRRRDLVACYDRHHIVVLMGEMPVAKARERMAEILAPLNVDDHSRILAGVSQSPARGAKRLEDLLAEADQALATARVSGEMVVVFGQTPPVAPLGVVAAPALSVPAPAAPVVVAPVVPAPVAAVPATPAPAPVARQVSVLLADDDQEVNRIVDAHIRAAGYKSILALDGEEAMAAILKHHPDILVMDMMMPRMTGFDVLTRLRQSGGPRPRVVVLSARGREQDVTRAFELGADDYVTKPFSPQELLARIARLLK